MGCFPLPHLPVSLTQTVDSAIFKLPLVGHVVIANEDSHTMKLALGELALVPVQTPDVNQEGKVLSNS